jgi:PKD repeat protein
VWLNNGGLQAGTPGTFSDSGQSLGDGISRGLALGDVDADGDLDALDMDRVWLNNGSGGFIDSGQSLGYEASQGVALGDLDGDGDLDIVASGGFPYMVFWNGDTMREPDIVVSPLALGLTLNPDDSANRTLSVSNVGNSDLTWSLSENPGVGWLSAAPTAGALAPSDSRDVALVFEADGLTDGTYATTLQVTSNDPDEIQVDVSVALTVTDACIPPSGVDFVFSPSAPQVDQVVTFTASFAAGSTPVTYAWDFGDGSPIQAGGPVTHTFAEQGAYSVNMTATNVCDFSMVQHTVSVEGVTFGDYEPNDTCAEARSIPTDGTVQVHTFGQQADNDWVLFDAISGTIYFIEAHVPANSTADVSLELFDQCGSLPEGGQGYAFSPEVRLEFKAPRDGPFYLRLVNEQASAYGSDVTYLFSARALADTSTPGAVVVVAGRLTENDPLQSNIHHVTDGVRRLFLAHDYSDDRILYLATDASLNGYDASATAAYLEAAITSWALDKVSSERPFTLYLMDHGAYDKLYLDKPRGEWVTPVQIDGWLDQLQEAAPGVSVNVILEACYSGSFIDPEASLSGPGRVVIASTGAWNLAWSSDQGAVFSDHFIDALDQGASLYASFEAARAATQAAHPGQTPWLDDNGNQIANEAADGQESALRGFTFAGTFADEKWPPYIAEASGPLIVQDGQGVIQAQVLDDEGVDDVWAVIYPPSYDAPEPGEEMVDEIVPTIMLQSQGNDDWYAATYTGFVEPGVYTVVVYAEDFDHLSARPVALKVGRLYLPLVLK